MAISDDIFHQGRTPTTDEIMKLEECRSGTPPSPTELQNQPSDQPTTADDSDRGKSQNKDGGGNERSELGNWREMYQIPYGTSCMDDRLGINVVSKFQNGEREPTEAELEIIESCDIERPDLLPDDDSRRGSPDKPDRDGGQDDSRGVSSDREQDSIEGVRERIESLKAVSGTWIRTGDPQNDQLVLGYLPNEDEWRCGVAEVGADKLRGIKAGTHTNTDEENQKLTPCFRVPPEELTHPLTQFDCIPLDILLEFVDYYRPSWKQLECHLEGLERYALPEKQIRYIGASDPFAIRNNKGPLYPDLWDRVLVDPYYTDLKPNFSASVSNMGMPPSYNEEYETIPCHYSYKDSNGSLNLDEYWLGEAIRGAAIGYIIEKQKGRRIYADLDMCLDSYVVQGNLDKYKWSISSVQDFRDRTLNVLLPGYAMKAKAAEAVKAEMMQINGLSGEVEVVFTEHEALYNLPRSEQIELAQWYLDTIIKEVRKHFNGMVWVASYANYDDGHPDFPGAGMNPTFGPHWEELSFAAADHVSFTMDSTCDFAHTKRYFNIQFDAAMRIVQRDGVTWHSYSGIPEDVYGSTFARGCKDDDYDEIPMHKWLLDKVDSLSIQPYFLNFIPQVPRSWTKDEEGFYPTAENAAQGKWQDFNLDLLETSEGVNELYMEYALRNIVE